MLREVQCSIIDRISFGHVSIDLTVSIAIKTLRMHVSFLLNGCTKTERFSYQGGCGKSAGLGSSESGRL